MTVGILSRGMSHPLVVRDKVQERLWGNIEKIPEAGCWIWMGYLRQGGYGQFGIRTGLMVLAHRMAYWLKNGPFDESLDVLHRCDVPSCINPAHLWLGTHTDNMHDMKEKGRLVNRIGSDHGCAKLTDEDVREIRNLYKSGLSQEKIGKKYGITQPNVGYIVRRETWQHVY